MRAVINALVLSLILISGSAADQNDPELDGLFDRLQRTQDADEAQVIIQRIWFIWYQHENPEIESFMQQGEVYMRKSEFEKAVAVYSRVIAIDPGFAEGWNRRATIYYLMGEYDLSTEDVKEVLALEPRHFGALSGQGLICLRQDKPEQSLKYFKQSLEVNPHMPHIRKNLEFLENERDDVI